MQTARIETTILSNLLLNEEFVRKVLPFLRPDYFHNGSEKLVFSTIAESITKYNKLPTSEQVIITLNEAHNVPEPEFKSAVELLNSLNEQSADNAWLTDVTEKFCKDKAIYNAIVDGIQIVEGKDKNRSPDALPALLSDALSVSFDPNVGHDYFEQSDDRFDFYHITVFLLLSSVLLILNKIIKNIEINYALNLLIISSILFFSIYFFIGKKNV